MKFRTNTEHYLAGDRFVPADTEIGDGTRYPLPEDFVPSMAMEGLDAESSKLVRELRERRNDPNGEISKRHGKAGAKNEISQLERQNAELREQLSALQAQKMNERPDPVVVANWTQRDGRLESETAVRRQAVEDALANTPRPGNELPPDPTGEKPHDKLSSQEKIDKMVEGAEKDAKAKADDEGKDKPKEPLKDQPPSSDKDFHKPGGNAPGPSGSIPKK